MDVLQCVTLIHASIWYHYATVLWDQSHYVVALSIICAGYDDVTFKEKGVYYPCYEFAVCRFDIDNLTCIMQNNM